MINPKTIEQDILYDGKYKRLIPRLATHSGFNNLLRYSHPYYIDELFGMAVEPYEENSQAHIFFYRNYRSSYMQSIKSVEALCYSSCVAYRGRFTDKAGRLFIVDILRDPTQSWDFKRIKLGATPLILEKERNSELDPVVGTVAKLEVWNEEDGEYLPLLTDIDKESVLVVWLVESMQQPPRYEDGNFGAYASARPFWVGVMDATQYEEPYNREARYLSTLVFHDLGALKKKEARVLEDLDNLEYFNVLQSLVSYVYKKEDWHVILPVLGIMQDHSLRVGESHNEPPRMLVDLSWFKQEEEWCSIYEALERLLAPLSLTLETAPLEGFTLYWLLEHANALTIKRGLEALRGQNIAPSRFVQTLRAKGTDGFLTLSEALKEVTTKVEVKGLEEFKKVGIKDFDWSNAAELVFERADIGMAENFSVSTTFGGLPLAYKCKAKPLGDFSILKVEPISEGQEELIVSLWYNTNPSFWSVDNRAIFSGGASLFDVLVALWNKDRRTIPGGRGRRNNAGNASFWRTVPRARDTEIYPALLTASQKMLAGCQLNAHGKNDKEEDKRVFVNHNLITDIDNTALAAGTPLVIGNIDIPKGAAVRETLKLSFSLELYLGIGENWYHGLKYQEISPLGGFTSYNDDDSTYDPTIEGRREVVNSLANYNRTNTGAMMYFTIVATDAKKNRFCYLHNGWFDGVHARRESLQAGWINTMNGAPLEHNLFYWVENSFIEDVAALERYLTTDSYKALEPPANLDQIALYSIYTHVLFGNISYDEDKKRDIARMSLNSWQRPATTEFSDGALLIPLPPKGFDKVFVIMHRKVSSHSSNETIQAMLGNGSTPNSILVRNIEFALKPVGKFSEEDRYKTRVTRWTREAQGLNTEEETLYFNTDEGIPVESPQRMKNLEGDPLPLGMTTASSILPGISLSEFRTAIKALFKYSPRREVSGTFQLEGAAPFRWYRNELYIPISQSMDIKRNKDTMSLRASIPFNSLEDGGLYTTLGTIVNNTSTKDEDEL